MLSSTKNGSTIICIASLVRRGGIGVELFPEAKKLGQQLQYADKRGFRIALIAGSRELDAGIVQVKNLATTQTEEVPLELAGLEPGAQLVAAIQRLLAKVITVPVCPPENLPQN